ncbi:hypothetical protein D3C71_1584750 [compost metagenome]
MPDGHWRPDRHRPAPHASHVHALSAGASTDPAPWPAHRPSSPAGQSVGGCRNRHSLIGRDTGYPAARTARGHQSGKCPRRGRCRNASRPGRRKNRFLPPAPSPVCHYARQEKRAITPEHRRPRRSEPPVMRQPRLRARRFSTGGTFQNIRVKPALSLLRIGKITLEKQACRCC